MASQKTIRILIETGDTQSKNGKAGDKTSKATTNPMFQNQGNEEKTKGQKTATNVLFMYAFNNAKNAIKNVVNASLDRYFALTEDYMNESLVNNIKTTISQIASGGVSILAGAKLGAIGGPVGMVVGATIGAVAWGGSQIFSLQNKYSAYNRQINENNINVGFARVRAGLVDGSKGTEN